ncbi:serine protease [Enterovibrio makurazakiensis]|uniref:serine protease n=1 Tax=Enterovibrio makurazakiensis TaxID=2910232 RepID=UPI003D2567EE
MRSWQRNATLALSIFASVGTVSAEGVKEPRIVSGSFASIESTPWQVFLDIGNSQTGYFACGGIIISDQYVLTAAHCIEGFSAADVRVFAGFEQLSYAGSGISVSKVIAYPDYDNERFTGDIALVKLSGKLPTNTQPIKLLLPARQSELDQEFENAALDNLYVSGWGATFTGGKINAALLKTTMNGVSDNQCYWTNDNNGVGPVNSELSNAYICADKSYTAGVCSGDSGGPLVWQDKNHAGDADLGYRAVGIVSFSSSKFGCGSVNSEDAFTQISSYHDWINLNMDGGYSEPSPTFSVDIFDPAYNYNPDADNPIKPVYPSDADSILPTPSSGGGGSIGWLSFVFVGMVAARRRVSYS